MSKTVHDYAIERAVNEAYRTDGGMTAIVQYRRGLQNRQYAHQDWFVQKSGGYTDEDALAFADLHVMLGMGELLCCVLPIDASPKADAQDEANRAVITALRDSWWHFDGYDLVATGDVWCGLEDDDGVINTLSPAPFVKLRGNPVADTTTREIVSVGPTQFPLEIGYTTAARSFFHIKQEGALARWCYGSDSLVLLKTA